MDPDMESLCYFRAELFLLLPKTDSVILLTLMKLMVGCVVLVGFMKLVACF